jgi:hypothetical protein
MVPFNPVVAKGPQPTILRLFEAPPEPDAPSPPDRLPPAQRPDARHRTSKTINKLFRVLFIKLLHKILDLSGTQTYFQVFSRNVVSLSSGFFFLAISNFNQFIHFSDIFTGFHGPGKLVYSGYSGIDRRRKDGTFRGKSI